MQHQAGPEPKNKETKVRQTKSYAVLLASNIMSLHEKTLHTMQSRSGQ